MYVGMGQVGDELAGLPILNPAIANPGSIQEALVGGNLTNPLSATGASTETPSQLAAQSAANVSEFTTTFTDWLNTNSTYVLMGGAALLLLVLFSGSGRRRR